MAAVDAAHADGQPTGLRARQREYTRGVLLAAAQEVFQSTGYAKSTIAQIADAAQSSRVTFYQYFGSKADIAVELMRDLSDHFDVVFSRLYAIDPLTYAGVRTWVRDAIELWDPANNPRLRIVDQATILEPEVRAARDVMARANIESLARFLRRRRRKLSVADATLHACYLIAEFHVLDNTQLLGLPATAPVVLDALARSWWGALGQDA